MSENENYCRNPDQSIKPWCYVQSGTGLLKEYCDIPSCGQFYKLFNFSLFFFNACKNCYAHTYTNMHKYMLHFQIAHMARIRI